MDATRLLEAVLDVYTAPIMMATMASTAITTESTITTVLQFVEGLETEASAGTAAGESAMKLF